MRSREAIFLNQIITKTFIGWLLVYCPLLWPLGKTRAQRDSREKNLQN
jgi:hypothetical protein